MKSDLCADGIYVARNYRFAQALPTGLVCLATNQIAGRGTYVNRCSLLSVKEEFIASLDRPWP